MSLQLAIPRRVALQQSSLPLHQPSVILKEKKKIENVKSLNCKCANSKLSQQRGSSHNSARSGGCNRRCAKQANDPTLSSSFVNCEGLSVCIQCDSAGSMTKQFLHYLDVCFSCP